MARGLSDGFSQAFELVVAPLLFGALGALADRFLGTGPVLMLVLGFFGFFAACATAYYRYERRMQDEEAELANRRGSRP